MPTVLEEIDAFYTPNDFSPDAPTDAMREFLICDQCFWSASSTKSDSLANCPVCNDPVTRLPIGHNDGSLS